MLLGVAESTSHTPPEDRQARLSGAGCGYSRHRRDISKMHTVHIFCGVRNTRGIDYTTLKRKLQVLFLKKLHLCRFYFIPPRKIVAKMWKIFISKRFLYALQPFRYKNLLRILTISPFLPVFFFDHCRKSCRIALKCLTKNYQSAIIG